VEELAGQFPLQREGSFRQVAVNTYRPNRIELDPGGGPGGFLVLSDAWFPGWKCYIDGAPAPIYRTNYLFRGVELPAQAHQVVFSFEPASVWWGERISIVAAVGVALVGLASLSMKAVRVLRSPVAERRPHALIS
jgi:hypothetical protein